MNKTKRILIIIMLISVIATKCCGVTVVEGEEIYVENTMELPYYYEGEEKSSYDILEYKGKKVYKLEKNNNSLKEQISNVTRYNNIEIRNIFDGGYPMCMYEHLGCDNWYEAYIATQEAIYCKLENKDVNKYIAENESGKRIITAMKNILEKAERPRLTIREMSDWNDLSSTEKYKDYILTCTHELVDCTIKNTNKNVRITDEEGNIKEKIKTSGKFRLVIPKNTQIDANIKFEGQIVSVYIHTFNTNENNTKQYILPEIKAVEEVLDFKVNADTVKVDITNKDEKNNFIVGSNFELLDSEYNKIIENLETDSLGKISLDLDKGKYYLRQTNIAGDYEMNKALLEIDIQDGNNTNISITNTKLKKEETTIVQKEINTKEETRQIKENNITEVTNSNTTNINREIINQRNVINLNNVNNFINTINRKNIINLEKENTYRNIIKDVTEENRTLDGVNINLNMTRSDYINYIDMLTHSKISVPILPEASK